MVAPDRSRSPTTVMLFCNVVAPAVRTVSDCGAVTLPTVPRVTVPAAPVPVMLSPNGPLTTVFRLTAPAASVVTRLTSLPRVTEVALVKPIDASTSMSPINVTTPAPATSTVSVSTSTEPRRMSPRVPPAASNVSPKSPSISELAPNRMLPAAWPPVSVSISTAAVRVTSSAPLRSTSPAPPPPSSSVLMPPVRISSRAETVRSLTRVPTPIVESETVPPVALKVRSSLLAPATPRTLLRNVMSPSVLVTLLPAAGMLMLAAAFKSIEPAISMAAGRVMSPALVSTSSTLRMPDSVFRAIALSSRM